MATGERGSSAVSAAEIAADSPIGAEAIPPRYVVVPRAPGPLRFLRRTKRGDDDDLDEAIDELFGDITDEEPGRFDVALLIAGAGLIAWWAFSGSTGPGLVLGIISIILGLALPTRNAIRTADRRWTRAKDRRLMRQGYPVDVSDPTVAALVRAYERVLKLAGDSRVPRAGEALDAAHRAVVEAASLLGTGRPSAGADTTYVKKRARAINRLGTSLKAARASGVAARDDLDRDRAAAQEEWTSAVAEAREELDASTGLGSIAELETLTERIDAGSGPDRHA